VVTFVRQVSANVVHTEVAINGYDTPVPMTCCVPIKAGGKVHWRAKFLLKPPAVAPLVETLQFPVETVLIMNVPSSLPA